VARPGGVAGRGRARPGGGGARAGPGAVAWPGGDGPGRKAAPPVNPASRNTSFARLRYPHAVQEEKTISVNRKARHEFFIEDSFEAGVVLSGTEIKSVRAGRVSLADAYARIDNGEAWLVGANISPWDTGNRYNHEPKRSRKLLLHRDEIVTLLTRTKSKGLTLVPLKLYITGRGIAKLEIGLAKGKQQHDKRRDIADRDARRDIERAMSDAKGRDRY